MKDFNRDEVVTAFNRAADEILEWIEASDEGKRDVANAIVNVGIHYLDFPGESLGEALRANYDDETAVLEWCRQ